MPPPPFDAPPPDRADAVSAELLGRAVWALATSATPAAPPPVEGLAVRGVAAFLSVSDSQVHALNAAGHLPAPAKLGDGRCPRWSATELRCWLLHGAPARTRWAMLRDAALRPYRHAG